MACPIRERCVPGFECLCKAAGPRELPCNNWFLAVAAVLAGESG